MDRGRPYSWIASSAARTVRPVYKHVVDEDHRGAVEGDGDLGHRAGHDRAEPDVVPVEGHVDRADGHRVLGFDPGDGLAEPAGDPHPAALQTDQHHAVETVVALDDLVGDAGGRPTDIVGRQHRRP